MRGKSRKKNKDIAVPLAYLIRVLEMILPIFL